MTRKSRTCLQHRAALLKNLLRGVASANLRSAPSTRVCLPIQATQWPLSGVPLRKPSFKQQAHELVEQLPEDAGWRELIYRADRKSVV